MSTTLLDIAAVRARFTALDWRLAFFDGPGGTSAPTRSSRRSPSTSATTMRTSALRTRRPGGRTRSSTRRTSGRGRSSAAIRARSPSDRA